MDEPMGMKHREPFREGTMEQTLLAERALRLCAIHHDVGMLSPWNTHILHHSYSWMWPRSYYVAQVFSTSLGTIVFMERSIDTDKC